MESKLEAVQSRELKQNIIIHGLVEDKDETYQGLVDSIKSFWKEQMLIEEEIEIMDAFRLGNKPIDHPVCVKLQHSKDKALIFANASNLKDKENIKKRLFMVQDNQMERQAETRRYYRELVKESKEEADTPNKFNVKMAKGSIVINGQNKIHQTPATIEVLDILRMDNAELEEIRAVKLIKGEQHVEKGSEFLSFAQKIKSADEVSKEHAKLKIKYADATHISYAYQLKSPVGPFRQAYFDDDEMGQGRNILKVLQEEDHQEICVYVVCYYRGSHLGTRRFEIGRNMTMTATKNLKVVLQAKCNRKSRRLDLQSSVFTDASNVTDDEEAKQEINVSFTVTQTLRVMREESLFLLVQILI